MAKASLLLMTHALLCTRHSFLWGLEVMQNSNVFSISFLSPCLKAIPLFWWQDYGVFAS